MKKQKNFFYIVFFCIFLFFILGETMLEPDVIDKQATCELYDGTWEAVNEDGTRQNVEYESHIEAERGELITFETVLKKDPKDGMYLCFGSSRQNVEIYVGDELRQTYNSENTRMFGKTSAPAYVFALLQPGDVGKTVRIETVSESSYSGAFNCVYYGDKMGIWNYLLGKYGMEMLIGIVMLLLGIFTAVISAVMGVYNNKQFELSYLGLGIALTAVWILCNSSIRGFFLPNVSVASNMAFLSVMLLPLPFMLYMNYEQRGRYQKIYKIMGYLVMADTVGCTLCHVFGIADFADTMYIISAVCIASIGVIVITTVVDAFRGMINEYKIVAMGIFATCIMGVVQIVMYFTMTTAMQGINIAVGLIFLMVAAIMKTVQDYLNIEKDKQMAISANESKSMFLANMSHEIRTPINAILGMDEIIIRDTDDKEILEYAKDIQSAGRSLLALINDILDFSKIESGKMELVPVEYELSSLINDSYNMIYMRARDKNLELKVRNYPNIPRRLYGDEVRIRQIIMNIMTNAVKYTQKGSVTLSVGCERVDEGNIILKLAVRDTGVGIKPEDQQKLFDSFKRIDMKRNRNIEGTGLGLAITKQLVSLMGGNISVKSEYGKGSIFYVDIPQSIVADEPMGEFILNDNNEDTVKEKVQTEFWTGNRQILVVDDMAINLKVFVGLLKDSGLIIDTALSGKECLEMAEKKKYDMIFIDHMMPDMDGMETFEEMMKSDNTLNKETPVIMLTANAVQGAKEEYMEAGFAGYIPKPVQRKQLEDMIKKYL